MSVKNTYERLATAAHIFYILLTLSWFITSYIVGSYINYISLLMFGIFCVQAYYNHRVSNLVLGLITMPASIFWGLQFLFIGGKTGFDAFTNIMMLLSVLSFVFSIILVFSYLKMSFGDNN